MNRPFQIHPDPARQQQKPLTTSYGFAQRQAHEERCEACERITRGWNITNNGTVLCRGCWAR